MWSHVVSYNVGSRNLSINFFEISALLPNWPAPNDNLFRGWYFIRVLYYILSFQLKSLRENMDSEGHPLMDNYRPTQVNANTLYFYGKAWAEYGHGLSPTYWFLQTTALELPFTSFTSTTGMNIYIITKRFKITQQINFYIRPLSSYLTCVWLKKMEWSG